MLLLPLLAVGQLVVQWWKEWGGYFALVVVAADAVVGIDETMLDCVTWRANDELDHIPVQWDLDRAMKAE